MTIDAIRLRNFRGFLDAQIELKPLTVLLGPNSSGKSSFGHALAAMAHAHWEHGTSGRATLSPPSGPRVVDWPIDLGTYQDLRTNGTKERVYIELKTKDGWLSLGFGNIKKSTDLQLSYVRHPAGISGTASKGGQVKLVRLGEATVSVSGSTVAPSLQVKEDVVELSRQNELVWTDADGKETKPELTGLVLNTAQHVGGGTSFPLSYPSQKELRFLLENTAYLRGVRRRPFRAYQIGKAPRQAIGYSGEFTASVYYAHRKKLVHHRLAVTTSGEMATAQKLIDAPWKERQEPLEAAVSYWLNHLGLGKRAEAKKSRRVPGAVSLRVALGETSRDLTEIGFGVSQALPLVVEGLLLPKGGLFIVDLPEAHLHPNPQASIADFFCSMALSGRNALVETHSEMFFHQLRLRAAMNQELADKIQVYFVDEPSAEGFCTTPHPVGLDQPSEIQWPVGFLDEAWKIESRIKLIREARQEKSR